MMNCIDAISQGDAREVFVIDLNYEIQSHLDNFCLEMQDKPGNI